MREWIRTCNVVAQNKHFGADYLGEDATGYTLNSVPSALRYRENILGQRLLSPTQEQNFTFAARLHYGSVASQNLDNLAWFQDVANWIHAQNIAGNFPEWEGGRITAIEPSNTVTMMQAGSDSAVYQLQIKVTYKI